MKPPFAGVFRSLRGFNYRVWVVGAFVSNVGTWVQRTAQDWLVLTQLTDDDATALGWSWRCSSGRSFFCCPGPASPPDASRFPTQAMRIEEVKQHIGAIVTGIDLAQPIDGATRKKLYDAVVENVVLVIRGQQHLTPGQLQAAGEMFGELMEDQNRRYLVDGFPYPLVRTHPETGTRAVWSATGLAAGGRVSQCSLSGAKTVPSEPR